MSTAALTGVLQHLRTIVHAKAYEETSDRRLLEVFCLEREEAAFITVLKRHGPMVFQVCRRILGNPQDAEDVFQATFLLLARKAGTIRKPESLASWLHGVAHRLALQANAQATRRLAYERRAARIRRPSSDREETCQELQETLDEALRQVPEKYRVPAAALPGRQEPSRGRTPARLSARHRAQPPRARPGATKGGAGTKGRMPDS